MSMGMWQTWPPQPVGVTITHRGRVAAEIVRRACGSSHRLCFLSDMGRYIIKSGKRRRDEGLRRKEETIKRIRNVRV